MYLNSLQKQKISNMLMNIAQAMFVAAFIGPTVNSAIGVFQSIQAMIVALLSFYTSIKLLEDEY